MANANGEKKYNSVNYGLYYSYEQDKSENFVYNYPYCYVVDEDILSSMKKVIHTLSDEQGFVIASAKFKAGVLYLKYPFNKEKRYLFSSMFCREYEYTMPDGRVIQRKKIGDYGFAPTTDMRLKIASDLCKIFHTLNNLQIYIRNFDENMFLYDIDSGKVMLDIFPAMLPYTSSQLKFMEQIYPAYYFASPNRMGPHSYSEPTVNTNNFFLSVILYKLFTGEELLEEYNLSTIVDRYEKRQLFINTSSHLLFSEFLEKYQISLLLRNVEKLPFLTDVNSSDTIQYSYPNNIKKRLFSARCVCGEGLYGMGPNPLICPKCSREAFGYVTAESTGTKVLLVGAQKQSKRLISTEYSPMHFGIEDTKRDCIFKLIRGVDSKGNFRCALMFLIQDDVYLKGEDTRTWEPYFGFNSQGNRIYTIDEQVEKLPVKIGNEVFNFVFKFDVKE
ncbi:MAG: hypothetical protein IJS61_09320 [Firmicutes bacterium]|nr:hypothetical protein [Bacillota bacterium]